MNLWKGEDVEHSRLRSGVLVVAATFAFVLGVGLTSPSTAHATKWHWCDLSSYSPHGNASKSGKTTLTIRRLSGPEDDPHHGAKTRFTASNKKTRFYLRSWSGVTRLSRDAFFKKYSGFSVSIDWSWRKGSRGVKYRYVSRIEAHYAN